MLPGLAPLGMDAPVWQGHTMLSSGTNGYWNTVWSMTLVEDAPSEDVSVSLASGTGPTLTFNTPGTYDFTFTWGGAYVGNNNDAANCADPWQEGTATATYVSHTGVTSGWGFHAPNSAMMGAGSGSGTATYVYTVTVTAAGQTLILRHGVGVAITLTNVAYTGIVLKRRD